MSSKMSQQILKMSNKPENVNASLNQPNFKKNPMNINEIIAIILEKIEVHQLIHLRVVCSKWKSAIESICKLKRNLKLTCVPWDNDKIMNRFFGSIKMEIFDELRLKRQPNWIVLFDPNLCNFFVQMFPNIHKLVVGVTLNLNSSNNLLEMIKMNWKNLETLSLEKLPFCSISDLIDKLKFIKKLDLTGNLYDIQNSGIFSQLEHFLCFNFIGTDLLGTMPQLGPNCTSFWFGCNWISVPTLKQWVKRNSPTVLANIAHLSLSMIQENDESLIRLISEKFHSLQVLSIKFTHWVKFSNVTCAQLVKLSHLNRLTLGSTRFDIISLENKDQLTQLASIRELRLNQFGITLGPEQDHYSNGLRDLDGIRFCRILSSIVPNLEELGIYSPEQSNENSVHKKIENNLSHFGKFVRYKMLSREFDL